MKTACIFRPVKSDQKKVLGNNVDFSTIIFTLKNVCGNNVDFLISESSSKKYFEITQKFVEIWSSTYRRNIDVESTSIQRGLPIGQSFIFYIFSLFSLVGTSVKCLFPLISSKYLLTLQILRYKGFTLLIFMYFESLIVT